MNYQANSLTRNISSSKKVALTAIMSALIAVTTVIAIPLPPPIATVNFAPVVIFVVSILLGARLGAAATAIGCGLGFLAATSIGTIIAPAPLFYLYLAGLIAARTPMAITAGLLRKKTELAGMILAVVVETFIFVGINMFFFGVGVAILLFGTFIDLISVPIAAVALIGARKMLNAKYLA